MTGKICRKMRLHWVAGFAIALALVSGPRTFGQSTTSTTLTAQSNTQTCPTSGLTLTLTTLNLTVTSASGVPAGVVNIEDEANGTPVQIASGTLNATGQATVSLYLGDGPHTLLAVYAGSTSYATSTSMPASAPISSQCDTSFAVSVSNISPLSSSAMTLAVGQSGTATVTVTPSEEYVASLNTTGAPAFITVSCSGLPSQAFCTFTPENLEVLPGQNGGVTSSMLIQTQGVTTPPTPLSKSERRNSPVAWAILLPGVLGLGGLAFGTRRRRWLQRLSLIALVALVTTVGTAGCNPQYYYYNDGPSHPPPTPTGTFNVTVTGQSTNGVSAITNTTKMTLTIQ